MWVSVQGIHQSHLLFVRIGSFFRKRSPFFYLSYPVVTSGRITPIFGAIRDHPEPIIWVSCKWRKKQLTCCNEYMWPPFNHQAKNCDIDFPDVSLDIQTPPERT